MGLSLNTPARANVKATVALNNKAAKSTEFCYGLPGAIEPIPQGFDPANLLEGVSKEEVYRWREAELTHGRVGMLASAGFLVQEKFHPLFSADGGPAIEQIPKLPVPLWFGMTLAIGIAETLRIQKGWANPYEGMDNVQRLKQTDPKELRTMQEKELSHGRLGMLAAAGFMAQEAVTGTTWGAEDSVFETLILGGWFDKAAIDTGNF